MAPVDGVGIVVEVVVGQLLQPHQLGVDLHYARGVSGAGVGVAHRGLLVDRHDAIQSLPRIQAWASIFPLIDFHPV